MLNPGTSVHPVAFNGGRADVECFGCFFNGHTGEESELHDLCLCLARALPTRKVHRLGLAAFHHERCPTNDLTQCQLVPRFAPRF